MQFCASSTNEPSLAAVEGVVGPGVEVLRMRDRLFTVVDVANDLAAGQVLSRLDAAIAQVGYDPEAALTHA